MRNMSVDLILRKRHGLNNITKRFQIDFLETFLYETENVKKYYRNLAKIFCERLERNLSKRFPVSLPESF